MIRIITDTGGDITPQEAKNFGIELANLDVKFDEFSYDYKNDADFSTFYGNLKKAKALPRTSQVNPTQYLDMFKDAIEKGDDIVVITLSGGLSGTYSSAVTAKEESGYEAITVIDSGQVAISQRILVEYAIKLRDEGKSRVEMEAALTEVRDRTGFCCCLDTMTYLQKGGRIPPALALIGNALKIKPVISLVDGKAMPIAKVRGFQAGVKSILDLLEKDGYDDNFPVYIGHTDNEERGKSLMEEAKARFNLKDTKLFPVGYIIGAHAGPDAVAVGYVKK